MGNWLFFTGNRRAGLTSSVIIIFVAPLALFLAHPAVAASFDCAKAATVIEKMICGIAELSKLDEVLGKEYARVLAQASDAAALKSTQRAWLRDTRDSCTDAVCLKAAYEARIGVLAEKTKSLAGAWNIMIVRGDSFELCHEYLRGLQEYNAPYYGYCGVAMPLENTDFLLPIWEDLDPAKNMNLVREIFYWTNAKFNYLWDYSYFLKRQRYEREIVPEMIDRLWEPAKADVMRLVAQGRIALQQSQLDLNFDGESEPVYRMTPLALKGSGRVSGDSTYPGFVIFDRQCKPVGLPGGDRDFVYFVRAADSHQAHELLRATGLWPGMNLFSWRGRVYWLLDGVVHNAQRAPTPSKGSFSIASLCRYDIKPSEQTK